MKNKIKIIFSQITISSIIRLGLIVMFFAIVFSLESPFAYEQKAGFFFTKYFLNLRPVDVIILSLFFFSVTTGFSNLRIPTTPINKYIAIILFICIPFGFLSGLQISGFALERLGIFDWKNLLLGILTFYLALIAITNIHSLKFLLGLLLTFVVIKNTYSLGLILLGRGIEFGGFENITNAEMGFLSTSLMAFSIMISIAIFKKNNFQKIVIIIGALVVSLAIVYSLRRGPVGSMILIIILISLFAKFPKKVKLMTIFILTGWGVFIGTYFIQGIDTEVLLRRLHSMNIFIDQPSKIYATNIIHRGDILDALDIIKEHPIAGIGFAQYYKTSRISKLLKEESVEVHNSFIHTWLKMGILGLIIYVFMFVSFLRYTYPKKLQKSISDPSLRATAIGLWAYILVTVFIADQVIPPFYLYFKRSAIVFLSMAVILKAIEFSEENNVSAKSFNHHSLIQPG